MAARGETLADGVLAACGLQRAFHDLLLEFTLQELACCIAWERLTRDRDFGRDLKVGDLAVEERPQLFSGEGHAVVRQDCHTDFLAEALVRSHVDALKRKMPTPEA